ncbi:RpiB/LacA/LacB family sugar-phosphate isomerase [Arthrobacter sp. AFG20]|uniref:RpiB/LacA/LacB family sugar-phosphate isomerase n=1 Tax=Arthrobacter sp. AFG20 TaxID=1688671 RepID=UPI000C9EC2A9|nr:RpiB/LacA/LacB family sugar-phosphate isomerase [Arthrobacter sp. AFG20]PNH78942.1 RpiB/LacA/LacB family sugar-phosphate isomerase [Arthrobacter sp. AFG20]
MLVGFGCDPNASALKTVLMQYAVELGHEVRDYGSEDPLYPRTAVNVAEGVAGGEVDRGVVMCGTGIGVSISANKVKGAYCALLTDAYQAVRAQLSNNANMIALGAQITGPESAKRLLHDYLENTYQPSERSTPKLDELQRIENRAY